MRMFESITRRSTATAAVLDALRRRFVVQVRAMQPQQRALTPHAQRSGQVRSRIAAQPPLLVHFFLPIPTRSQPQSALRFRRARLICSGSSSQKVTRTTCSHLPVNASPSHNLRRMHLVQRANSLIGFKPRIAPSIVSLPCWLATMPTVLLDFTPTFPSIPVVRIMGSTHPPTSMCPSRRSADEPVLAIVIRLQLSEIPLVLDKHEVVPKRKDKRRALLFSRLREGFSHGDLN